MTWFRIDDGFHEHAKVEMLEDDPTEHAFAIAAWTLCGSACSRRLTDGVVTRAALAKTLAAWPEKQRARAAAALVRVGLWDMHADGWQYHDWHDRNPSRDDVLRERDASRRRQAEWKAKRRVTNGGSNGGSNVPGNAVTSGVATGAPTRPDPTRSRSEISEREGSRDLVTREANTGPPSEPARSRSAWVVGYARRFERATGGLAPNIAHYVPDLERSGLDDAGRERALDAFFATPRHAKTRPPFDARHLAADARGYAATGTVKAIPKPRSEDPDRYRPAREWAPSEAGGDNVVHIGDAAKALLASVGLKAPGGT